MSIASTGTISLVFAAPVALPDPAAPDGLRIDQQISLTLKLASDDKEYQFNLPVTEQTIGLDQTRGVAGRGQARDCPRLGRTGAALRARQQQRR